MDEIPDGSVDLVLTDPPYGITKNAWDVAPDLPEMFRQFWRVLKPNGAALVFAQMPFAVDLVNASRKQFRYQWVVKKHNALGFLNANRMPLRAHELILVFYRRLPEYHPQKWISERGAYVRRREGKTCNIYGKRVASTTECLDGTRYPIDILRFNFPNLGHGTLHPTQKPVALCEYMIRTYTSERQTVLDAFMGSGSTGVACQNTGREFIGIEKDAGYFEIAERRLMENAIREPV